MTDVKQKAREVVSKYANLPVNIVDALDSANLLHDPEEVERGKAALEACVAFAEKYLPMSNRDLVLDKDVWMRVHDAGRAELERRKPRPRWRVYDAGNTMGGGFRWALLDGPNHDAAAVAYFLRQNEAEAEAARRNAEEAK